MSLTQTCDSMIRLILRLTLRPIRRLGLSQ